ncbi:amidohydrolase family protein [Pontiella agarivorans]|uniref:Amidohydrolase family protein n=1 Tax=Pontiella agarivorans TaxID=3038953 RepID=A0ABU5MSB9_9BACT|nr:amidohydrolase family protein [Pontiella agarivorans]MDZ8117013.1 amidohydrolase family protein [Pontiella agarivorans]
MGFCKTLYLRNLFLRIDAHQHFWKYDAEIHSWMEGPWAVLRHDFLPADFQPVLQESEFDGSIAVHASQTASETHWLLEQAEQHSFILGVTGWIDLLGDVSAQLTALPNSGKLRALRHFLQFEEEAFFQNETFRENLRLLGEKGLPFELLITPDQLQTATELVQACPETTFVLDHLAKPDIAGGEFACWQTGFGKLAACTNVHAKVSGLVTQVNWESWKPADLIPYLDAAFDVFGPERLMAGSDWPVCSCTSSHAEVMNILKNYMKNYSEKDQAAVFGCNCARIYGIEEYESV